MKTFYTAALAVCATAAFAQPPDGIPADAAGGTLQRGIPAAALPHFAGGNASTTSPLIYHNGPVLANANVYYIWWGTQSAWSSADRANLGALIQGLGMTNNTGFMQDVFLAPGYMNVPGGSTSVSATLVSAPWPYNDNSAPPTHGPQTSTIVNEACKAITALGKNPDSNGLYVVFTSNFPRGVNYCAWHSWGSCNGTMIQVAYMPNTTGVSGCNDPVLSCNSYSQTTQGIANVLSHEFSETLTDPQGSAWYDSSGQEIGDKCAWQFQSCVNLPNGTSWQLQTEWSNLKSACIQQ